MGQRYGRIALFQNAPYVRGGIKTALNQSETKRTSLYSATTRMLTWHFPHSAARCKLLLQQSTDIT